ncbi:extracellular solute-binding protein [Haloarchaeobius sp. HME9146]|uniref:extracellular solute-binding protein n=1 Tax=Haloarchaeobius sp. HME9146 TaxID=2978732 RepID=UPI0021C2484D|nr:extracellular solute-binding protein [Haloarchaeobius sp. HME9146]
MKVAGASGVGVGLAGCVSSNDNGGDNSGGGGGEDTDTETQISTEAPTEDITVQFAGDSNFKKVEGEINKILHENGLPENITLEVIAGSFTTGDRKAKYKNILSAGQQKPTIMMMDNGWMIPFVVRGQLQNLSKSVPSEITEKVKSDYFEASVATATMDGDLYGIPLFTDVPTIHYRKDLVEQAGYDPDNNNWATEPMSWQKFSRVISDTMEQTGKDGFTWQGKAYEGLSCCAFNEFMSTQGGAYFGGMDNLFGPVGDRPITVTEEPVIRSLKMMRTFIHGSSDDQSLDSVTGNISPQAVVQMTEEPSREPFTNGDAIANRNWPYSIIINGAEDAWGKDLGTMPVPYGVTPEESKYDGIGGTSSALGGWHLGINPNSSDTQKQAAVQIFKAITKEEAQLRLFELGGWIPPVPSVLESQKAKQLDIIGRYLDTLRVGGQNMVPRPVTRVWGQESTQISKEVNATLQQNKSPSKAMESLAASLEQIENSV